jgi:hypothetical protein
VLHNIGRSFIDSQLHVPCVSLSHLGVMRGGIHEFADKHQRVKLCWDGEFTT